MTDAQWSQLTRHLKLPTAARDAIECELELYQSYAEFKAQARRQPPPHQAKKKLERAAQLAAKLLDIFDSLDKVHAAYDVLVDPTVSEACVSDESERPEGPWGHSMVRHPPLKCPEGKSPNEHAMALLCDHRAHLAALGDRFWNAATKFPAVKKHKERSYPSPVRNLIRAVNKIVRVHTGRPLSKQKPRLNFARCLGRIAYPRIGPGPIREAIENLKNPSRS
jgi:hypothetical protein